jgi:hypothetical protein
MTRSIHVLASGMEPDPAVPQKRLTVIAGTNDPTYWSFENVALCRL